MDLYVLAVKWAASGLFCNLINKAIDPIEFFEIFHVFIQREHTITNSTGFNQMDIIAVQVAIDLTAGGDDEADITGR